MPGSVRRRASASRRPRGVGIVDVAARAGVSAATVSRALRDDPAVTAATRAKVRAAAQELGYSPSAFAAALASGASNTVGVVSPWMSRWFFATVIEGINDVVAAHGYDLMLYPVGVASGSDARHFNALGLDKRVDGVIGLAMTERLRFAATLRRLPIVTVGTSTDGFAGVQVDDAEVGYLATRHLLELGHRRIAFVGLDPDDIYGFNVADDRYGGYLRALAEFTVPADPALRIVAGFETEGGEAGFEELLARAGFEPAKLPTAVVAVSDELAIGLMFAARQWGVRVPQDLSVVGVDDHDMARYFGLTTVAQPVIEQGRLAASILCDLMAGAPLPNPAVRRLRPGLVVRASAVEPRPGRR
jgi:DNA-binding LacI/PurR family transcriptional regulator